jgi:hypothetical protein
MIGITDDVQTKTEFAKQTNSAFSKDELPNQKLSCHPEMTSSTQQNQCLKIKGSCVGEST